MQVFPIRTLRTFWKIAGGEARAALRSGRRVLLHCRAGLGRTGMIAARLLVELGATPDEAIAAVRHARPQTIETRAQEQHVSSQSSIAGEPLSDQTFKDRVHGSVLGAAIGDALGSAFEFLSSAEIKSCIGGPVVREYFPAQPASLMCPREPGIPTDDTAMTLALIDALIQPGAPSARSIFDSFGETLRQRTGRFADMFWNGGPGGACVAMLRGFDAGAAPFEQLNPKAGGNGAAMRAHACGAFSDRAFFVDIAAQQAGLSHPHPSAIAAAQVVALVVHEGIYAGRLMAKLPPEITDPQMVRAWNAAHENLVRGVELPAHLRDADMAGWNTVATAHAIAQLYADDIETGIGVAAGSGRDTDTVASIVGAMLGAVHGRGALPTRWIDGLQHRTVIETAADDLCRNVALRDREQTASASLALRASTKS
jgi:ADP-ribosyl-[dinitrogen reductase] hydrolase